MRVWFAMGIMVTLAVISFAALAGDAPPRRHLSWWDAMLLWQGPPRQAQEEKKQEQEKQKEQHKKPKPCDCLSPRTGGEAVNYPPYDLEP